MKFLIIALSLFALSPSFAQAGGVSFLPVENPCLNGSAQKADYLAVLAFDRDELAKQITTARERGSSELEISKLEMSYARLSRNILDCALNSKLDF